MSQMVNQNKWWSCEATTQQSSCPNSVQFSSGLLSAVANVSTLNRNREEEREEGEEK